MISGNRRFRSTTWTLAIATLACSINASWAAISAEALLPQLRVEPPASIEFTEVRFSRLLSRPLRVSGTLSYLGPEQLDRRIESPYSEVAEIRRDSVRMQREGEPPRSFALSRAPELRALLNTFSALLGGDVASVLRQFAVETSGDMAAWELALIPRDAKLLRRIERLTVLGQRAAPRCFAVTTKDGALSIMVLGAASRMLPASPSRDSLLAQCRGGA